MKKRQSMLALALVFLLLFTACGASSQDMAMTTQSSSVKYESAVKEEVEMEEAAEEVVEISTSSSTADSSRDMSVEEVQDYAEKIIYSGYVSMETTEFDTAIAALDQAVKEYGGFVQDSNVNGSTYRYDDGSTKVKDRWANYVVRIPAEKFDAFMALTDGIGSVTSSSRSAENITSQYTDYEARLSSLKTQEERLLSMLDESGDLESLIALEARLSEVRYEIESIERNLRNFDQRLAYSTVTLNIQEVEIITPTVAVQRTYGQKLGDAFADGWNSFVRSLQRFTINTARSVPTLVLLAVLAVVAVLVVRKVRRKIGKKTEKPVTTDSEQNGK